MPFWLYCNYFLWTHICSESSRRVTRKKCRLGIIANPSCACGDKGTWAWWRNQYGDHESERILQPDAIGYAITAITFRTICVSKHGKCNLNETFDYTDRQTETRAKSVELTRIFFDISRCGFLFVIRMIKESLFNKIISPIITISYELIC